LEARDLVAAAKTGLQVKFALVKYSAMELEDLSSRLLENQSEWAGAFCIGGGYDPQSNRVLLQLDPKYKDADKVTNAIKNLEDPRISLQILEPVGDGVRECSRAERMTMRHGRRERRSMQRITTARSDGRGDVEEAVHERGYRFHCQALY
jgi:hypothetical protein